jgi:hypothetical protein
MQIIALLVDQELGVTDNVDEQDMSDLQVEIVVGFRRHEPFLTRRPPSAHLFLTIRRRREKRAADFAM